MKAYTILLAGYGLCMCACSGSAVVDPPSGGGAGQGGSGAEGGGGSGAGGVTFCDPSWTSSNCFACFGQVCGSARNACCNEPGCSSIVECGAESCLGNADPDCVAAACASEITASGGPNSDAAQLAQSFRACAVDDCGGCL